MAVSMEILDTTLRLKVLAGTNEKGDPVFKTRSYKDVKKDAEPQDVYEVGQGLASLMKYSLDEIQLLQNSNLTEI